MQLKSVQLIESGSVCVNGALEQPTQRLISFINLENDHSAAPQADKLHEHGLVLLAYTIKTNYCGYLGQT